MNPEIAISIGSKPALKLVSVGLIVTWGSTGAVVIQPQFDCAYPFENGAAQVSSNCKTEHQKEHSSWQNKHWNYIDKNGSKTEVPKPVDE